MTDRHELRWGGFAGLGFVILALVGYFLPGIPTGVDSSSDEIAAYVGDNSTVLLWSALMFAAAAVLLVWFATAFAEAIRERAERSLLHLALTGGAVLVGGALFVNSVLMATTAYGVDGRGTELTVAMFEGTAIMTSMIGLAAALPLGAAGAGVLRTHLMPDWLGYLAILAAVVAIAGSFAIFFTSGALLPGGIVMAMVPLLVSALFILAASYFMVREHLPEVVMPTAMPQT